MVGGNTEYEMSQSRKLESENSIINLVGKTDLQELYNILRGCELYIGPDSGTLHIASILNRPVIGLYATSNPDRTGPIDNMENIINKYPLALQKYHQMKIEDAKWGKRIRDPSAMKLINIDEVVIKSKENTDYTKYRVFVFLLGTGLIIFSETTQKFIKNSLEYNIAIFIMPIIIFIIFYFSIFYKINFNYKKNN